MFNRVNTITKITKYLMKVEDIILTFLQFPSSTSVITQYKFTLTIIQSLHSLLHLIIPTFIRFSLTSSIYLLLGVPLDLLPSGLRSRIFLDILCCSIFVACPIQAILFIYLAISISYILFFQYKKLYF